MDTVCNSNYLTGKKGHKEKQRYSDIYTKIHYLSGFYELTFVHITPLKYNQY